MILNTFIFFIGCVVLFTSSSPTPINQTTEIDLIFPLNNTYQLVAPFPIIFAIQNVAVAWDFGLNLNWYLQGTGSSADNFFDSGTIMTGFVETNAPSNPYIIVNSTALNGVFGDASLPAGTWNLTWDFISSDCTKSSSGEELIGSADIGGSLFFTTVASGGDPVDLTAACPHLAVQIPYVANWTGCPEIGNPDSVGKGNPCAVKLDDAQASSISAELGWTTVSSAPSSSATKSRSASGAVPTESSSFSGSETGTASTGSAAPAATPTGAASKPGFGNVLISVAAGIGGVGVIML